MKLGKLNPADVKAAVNAQKEYCRRRGVPLFIPSDGVCYCCGGQIFGSGGWQISKEQAGSKHITGCPLCSVTFCD